MSWVYLRIDFFFVLCKSLSEKNLFLEKIILLLRRMCLKKLVNIEGIYTQLFLQINHIISLYGVSVINLICVKQSP